MHNICQLVTKILDNMNQFYMKLQLIKKMIMKPWVAIVALVNGMIGGVILVLPILALNTGYIYSLIIIFASGFFSFYSCFLYIEHLSSHSDSDKAIYYHFGSSKAITIFYNLSVFVNMQFILITYFLLIVQQWNGLAHPGVLNPIMNAIALYGLVMLLKYIRFGAHLLGYGIISIFIYCIFLIWILVSEPAGDNKMPTFGTGSARTAAAMAQAFSIQQFFIPVLKQLPMIQAKNFKKLTLIVYVIGGVVYIFIAMVGSFGILNRTQIFPNQSIQGYFKRGEWQVLFIQAIYLIHLYSAFGWFMLITKKRLFCVFHMLWDVKNSRTSEFFTVQQVIFVIFSICLALGIDFWGVSLETVIVINGSVIGFFFIYLIPAAMHFKCLFMARPKSIFQVVFVRNKQKQSDNVKNCELSERNNSSTIRSNMGQSFMHQGVQNQGKNQKSRKQTQLTSQQNPSLKLNQTEAQKPKQRKDSNFLMQKLEMEQKQNNKLLLAGADISIDLSGRQQAAMSVSKINYLCQCERREGIKKILDLISIFGMVLFGLYIMVMGIISVTENNV